MNAEAKKPEEKPFSAASLVEMMRNMWIVNGMVWKEKKHLVVLMTLATVAISSFSFMRSGANGLLINELTRATKEHEFTMKLFWMIAFMVAVYALPSFVSSLRRYWDKSMHMRMTEVFELMILKKRATLDLARYEDPSFQDLDNKASDRGPFSFMNMIDGQYDMLAEISGIIIASAILLSINKSLWFILILGEVPSLIVQMRYSHQVWNIYGAQSPTKRKFFHFKKKFHDSDSLSELQLFQNTGHFLSRIEGMLAAFNAELISNDMKRFRSEAISGLVSTSAIGIAIAMIIVNVVNGSMQIGTWLFITGTMLGFQSSFSGLFNTVSRLYESSLFATDMRKVLATEPVIKWPHDGIKVLADRIPGIEFRNVTFKYPGKDEYVFKNVSFTIKPGQIVAIVGENGVGKTTLAKLLCRIYDPQEGVIYIDGVDLRQIDKRSWYAVLAILSQTYNNYCFPVDEAISLGRTDKPMNRGRVIKAAQFSGADKFIEGFEEQYSQQLGQEFGGVGLSKGQQQRMALSRVAHREGMVVVLDEPTAATDAEAEAAIFDRVYGLRGTISAIITTHNFANVKKADRIILMKDGKIAEEDSHVRLMKANGIYARLFRLQAKRFQED